MNKLPHAVDIDIVYENKLKYDIKVFDHDTQEELQGISNVEINVKNPGEQTYNAWTPDEFKAPIGPIVAQAKIALYNVYTYTALIKKITTTEKRIVVFA